MSLKEVIKRSQILKSVIAAPMELEGEPMIYSLKYPVGKRTRGLQFFRNMQWKSLLKCNFRAFMRTTIPVVLIVRFYVSPPASVSVSSKLLRQESEPAVMAFELCDYTLSFLEMLHHVLINSYKQVVKLDVEKYYSSNPRTVMKFMRWDEYVELQSRNTNHPKAESVSEIASRQSVQSKRKRNEANRAVRTKTVLSEAHAAAERTAAGDSPLCAASPAKLAGKKTKTAKLPTSHEEAGRGQPGEVSQ